MSISSSAYLIITIIVFSPLSVSFSFPTAVPEESHEVGERPVPDPRSPTLNIQSLFSKITNSLRRIIPFQQNTTTQNATAIPNESQQVKLQFQPLQTNHPQKPLETPPPPHQLTHEDLIDMVRLWITIFQAVEAALNNDNIKSHPPPSEQNQFDQRPVPQTKHTSRTPTIDDGQHAQQTVRDPLPDVTLALAHAAQLNRQREIERQHQIAQYDQQEHNHDFHHHDVDYIRGLPKFAPSYPTRVRLQIAANQKRRAEAR